MTSLLAGIYVDNTTPTIKTRLQAMPIMLMPVIRFEIRFSGQPMDLKVKFISSKSSFTSATGTRVGNRFRITFVGGNILNHSVQFNQESRTLGTPARHMRAMALKSTSQQSKWALIYLVVFMRHSIKGGINRLKMMLPSYI